MIDKQGKVFHLICDICGEEAECDFMEFQEAVDYKKANGWKAKKLGADWMDCCVDCIDFAKNSAMRLHENNF